MTRYDGYPVFWCFVLSSSPSFVLLSFFFFFFIFLLLRCPSSRQLPCPHFTNFLGEEIFLSWQRIPTQSTYGQDERAKLRQNGRDWAAAELRPLPLALKDCDHRDRIENHRSVKYHVPGLVKGSEGGRGDMGGMWRGKYGGRKQRSGKGFYFSRVSILPTSLVTMGFSFTPLSHTFPPCWEQSRSDMCVWIQKTAFSAEQVNF